MSKHLSTAPMKESYLYFFILLLFASCNKVSPGIENNDSHTHLDFFGFTLIDTYWDDPTDTQVKVNYADEVKDFSNLADILVISPNDTLTPRIKYFYDFNLKALLHLNELFFVLQDSISPSGANYDLRPDYQERWDSFVSTNEAVLNHDHIGAFYIGEEPTWNGITFEEMNQVSKLLEEQYPRIPTMIIEAYPSIKDLKVPETVDWVGFDRYFIKNPLTNNDFQNNWKDLKSKISNPSQRIMVIMDSHYINWAHGDYGNIQVVEMEEVADNYYQLAKSDTTVIGVLGYFWPNGFDFPESLGARGMPQNVLDKYVSIGKEITGK